MPPAVAIATEADLPRLFEIASDAFARNEPLFDILFPEHWTAAGRKVGGERFLLASGDTKVTFLKAYDESTGEILGMAKWILFKDFVAEPVAPAPAEGEPQPPNYWATAEEKLFADDITKQFLEPRNSEVERTKGSMLSLDMLAVDPRHQRKKVGDALARWGTAVADEHGIQAVVESSVPGRPLYEKHGFVFQREVVFVAGEPHVGSDAGGVLWMIRPKKGAVV